MERMFWGNTVREYAIALLILIAGLAFIKIVILVLVRHLKKLAAGTATKLDDLFVGMLEEVALPALYLGTIYVSIKTLKLSAAVGTASNIFLMAIATFFAARLAIIVMGYAMHIYLEQKREEPTLVRSLEGMMKVAQFLIWALAGIIFLDNLGYKVSTLLAGLGIGGVAVAIAAQALLKDFFSYFSIVFDHPFKLGDFIIIGDYMGTVEHIGIKTTRIRSLSGEQIIFSNTDLTDSRVRNYKLMEKRRVVFGFGVTYETSLALLKEIPKIVEGLIRNVNDTAFDRAHFFKYGDSSLNFEVVYFVLSPDYNKYMDIQQEINFAIKGEFEKRGIAFAYPTRTLYMQRG